MLDPNDIIDYIEARIAAWPSPDEIARAFDMPTCQLRALFLLFGNLTPAEYIRRRRLSRAGELLAAGLSVTQVAFELGYDSVEGFSRAYKAWTDMLPSEAQRTGSYRNLPRITFPIPTKEVSDMEYRICDLPAFNFAGVAKRVPMQFEGENNAIVELAQSITPEQRAEMHRVQNIDPREVLNISWDSDTDFMREEGELTHMIGIATTENHVGCDLELVPVPAGTWAVFPSDGPFPQTLQNTYAAIYAEWLGSSSYELVRHASFSFTRMNENGDGTAYSEVWVPVRPKQQA